jgi:nucleotide-binding universal stress UspA family protein
MFQRILVALDNSAMSKFVFEKAVALAQTTNAHLLLVHVLSPMDEDYPDLWGYSTADIHYPSLYREVVTTHLERWSNYEQHQLEVLRSLAAEAESIGIAAEFSQSIGDAGRSICAVAHTWNADLIVIGRRGRSGLSELLMGSVSNYVMHHAPCSVLTVQHVAVAPLEVEEQIAEPQEVA